jgi:hypothetical protein
MRRAKSVCKLTLGDILKSFVSHDCGCRRRNLDQAQLDLEIEEKFGGVEARRKKTGFSGEKAAGGE